jgi:NHL repeat
VDKQDRVFCFTRSEHPVIVFDRDGKFLRSWGEGVVRRAHGITIDADDMVWLTDDLHHTVRKFTPEGKLLLTIGNPDSPAELQGGKPFNRPTHVAICPKSGYLFVSDGYGNSRVHKYAPDGTHVMSWGEPGTDPGQFNLPHNLVTDRDGLVYVADRENHRVQIFDGKGQYQGQWNNLHRPCGLFADRDRSGLFFVGELGSGMPVTEKTPNLGPRVSVLDGRGQRVARFGGPFASEKPGEFFAPHGLVVDSRGDVYVGEVSWTGYGQFLNPPRELRSFQKFKRSG